jgi:hypothetical protein
MTQDQIDLDNRVVWNPDSKTPNGVAEVLLTGMAVEAFRDQLQVAGKGTYVFPRDTPRGYQATFKTSWAADTTCRVHKIDHAATAYS